MSPSKATSPQELLRDPSLWYESVVDDSNATFNVLNPATEQVLGSLKDMDVKEARIVIQSAHETFKTYSKTNPQTRANIIQRFHQLVLDNQADLATLIVLENGKAYKDAVAEVLYAASYLQWNSGEALRMYGRTVPGTLPGVRNYTVLEPVGVVAALCPWNFPVGMICRKVGPALAVGATVVVKCPAETPYSVLALLKLAERAGVPEGVISVITTDKHLVEIGQELCSNKKVKKISFTGSTRIGKLLMSQASGTLKKLSMELGGNAPFIVFEDADIDLAVKGAMASKFRGGGQTCVCANRIYVHDSIHDEFARRLAQAADELSVGPGLDEDVSIGPLIHARAVAKCVEHVNNAIEKGGKVLTQPRRGLGTNYFPPTVIANVAPDCLIQDEETFGPVAAIFRFTKEDEVIEMANDTDFGLAAYFFTKDGDRASRVSSALQTGMVGVNTGIISQAVIPFGGVKESGFGKEGGSEAILDFCVVKTVIVGSS